MRSTVKTKQIKTVEKKQEGEESDDQLHDGHGGNVIIVCHCAGDLGGAKCVLHEVRLTASDYSLDVVVVGRCMLHKALLALVNHGKCKEEEDSYAEVGNQDERKSGASGLFRGFRGVSGRGH